MPNRILKESICTSDTLNGLTWFEEVVFYRLMVNCDDYGRFDGRGEIIKSRLFPLKDGKVTVKSVVESIHKLATAGLVVLYEYEGKPYLQLSTWDKHQQVRAKKSKYPAFDETCNQMISNDCKCPRNPIQSESESESESNPETHEDVLLGLEGALREKVEEWLRYKSERHESYKPTGLRSLIATIRNKRKVYSDEQICDLIDCCMSNGWKGMIWDRLKECPPAAVPKSAKQNSLTNIGDHSSLDMDRLSLMLYQEAMRA